MPLPTVSEKRQFISDLIQSVRDEILSTVSKMPTDWDGHELRQLIADKFRNQASRRITGKRLKEFRNEVATRNI